jgi:fructokinase
MTCQGSSVICYSGRRFIFLPDWRFLQKTIYFMYYKIVLLKTVQNNSFMKNIYAIGEALVDIIFRDGQPKAARPGGAMLNTAVSLGRIGLPVYLITEYADDETGNLIDSFLNENNVSTRHVNRFRGGKTALALAFLDNNNNAHYTFYKDYPAKRLGKAFPPIKREDILLYGSIYSITPEIRSRFIKLVNSAARNKALMIYDPNFRKSHATGLKRFKPLILENLKTASIVRGSDEDFRNIFGAENSEEAWKMTRRYCSCLIYTASDQGVNVRTHSYSWTFPVREITPLSTIGAGDNFNAGLIASFCAGNLKTGDLAGLRENEWHNIISTAVDFATNVCLSYDNYIDLAFASRYRSASRLHM